MPRVHAKKHRKSELDSLFKRANEQWDQGKLRSAFRLFLAGAKAGDTGAQTNLGYFYGKGVGVKPNRALELQWYRRAYRHGDGAAASNIGIIWRDEGKRKQALKWFERAVRLGFADANLDIAKIYLTQKEDKAKAIHYLRRALRAKANDVMQASKEEAQRLLKGLRGV